MIRKAIIVVLTLGAVGVGVAGMASRVGLAPSWSWNITDQLSARLSFDNGRLRASTSWDVPHIVRTRGASWGGFHYLVIGVKHHNGNSREFRRVHCPFLAPVVLLAVYPTIAFIRGPLRRWRRRRRGLCAACGYDPTGNTTGVCSECGEATQIQ